MGLFPPHLLNWGFMGISALLLTPCSLEMNGKLQWRFTGDYLDTGKVIIDSNDIKRRANGGFFMRHLCINIVYTGFFFITISQDCFLYKYRFTIYQN